MVLKISSPAMILGYTLVYILQATGIMDLLGSVLSPVMGIFGLPGEAFAVLISAFFAKAAGCGTAATMYANGILTMGQACMLFPACILIVTVILTDRFLFSIKEGFILACAVISAVALILSITRLKLIEVREEAEKKYREA